MSTENNLKTGETKEEIIAVIKAVIAENLGVAESEITEEKSFSQDLGADSLDSVELIMALEDKFGISIPDEEAEKLTTVGKLINYALEKKKL